MHNIVIWWSADVVSFCWSMHRCSKWATSQLNPLFCSIQCLLSVWADAQLHKALLDLQPSALRQKHALSLHLDVSGDYCYKA